MPITSGCAAAWLAPLNWPTAADLSIPRPFLRACEETRAERPTRCARQGTLGSAAVTVLTSCGAYASRGLGKSPLRTAAGARKKARTAPKQAGAAGGAAGGAADAEEESAAPSLGGVVEHMVSRLTPGTAADRCARFKPSQGCALLH